MYKIIKNNFYFHIHTNTYVFFKDTIIKYYF